MTADNVIKLPMVSGGEVGEMIMLPVRLPRRVYRRLSDLSDMWGLTPLAAAEALLLEIVNDKSGVRRK